MVCWRTTPLLLVSETEGIRLRGLVPEALLRPLVGSHQLCLSHLHEAEVTVLAYPFKDAGFKYFIFLNNMLSALGGKRLSFGAGKKRLGLPSSVMVQMLPWLANVLCLLSFYWFLSITETL